MDAKMSYNDSDRYIDAAEKEIIGIQKRALAEVISFIKEHDEWWTEQLVNSDRRREIAIWRAHAEFQRTDNEIPYLLEQFVMLVEEGAIEFLDAAYTCDPESSLFDEAARAIGRTQQQIDDLLIAKRVKMVQLG